MAEHPSHPPDPPADAPEEAAAGAPPGGPVDLDGIEADLAAVEVALGRLDAGDYWRDEVTGAEIDDVTLAADPTARRSAPPPVT